MVLLLENFANSAHSRVHRAHHQGTVHTKGVAAYEDAGTRLGHYCSGAEGTGALCKAWAMLHARLGATMHTPNSPVRAPTGATRLPWAMRMLPRRCCMRPMHCARAPMGTALPRDVCSKYFVHSTSFAKVELLSPEI